MRTARGGTQLAFAPKRSETKHGFERRQSLIKGLLVVQLQGSQFAGTASQMNATAVPTDPGAPTTVRFNQPVGESMNAGLKKVLDFLGDRHEGVPPGNRIELSFERHYSPKDGDSASVACALLLHSLVEGTAYDPGFAVTGAMQDDGAVTPVGGIDGKIRGAAARDCTHVAIPKGNEIDLIDLLLMDGVRELAAIQIFTLETFDDALALAVPESERSDEVQESLTLFDSVRKALLRRGGERLLRNPKVQSRLRRIIQLTPNHASARVLLLQALGRAPDHLTLQGSLTAIDRTALPLIQGLGNTSFGLDGAGVDLKHDQFAEAAYGIRRLRSTLHPDARTAADTIMEYAERIRELKNHPPNNPANYNRVVREINTVGRDLVTEYNRLIERIKEEPDA